LNVQLFATPLASTKIAATLALLGILVLLHRHGHGFGIFLSRFSHWLESYFVGPVSLLNVVRQRLILEAGANYYRLDPLVSSKRSDSGQTS
jgi:hypothetical protein